MNVFTDELIPSVSDLYTPDSDARPGYDFAGWYTLPIGGKLVTANDITEDKDYTFYAHWTRNGDNICTLDDGTTMLCPLGETLPVPHDEYQTFGHVNEIANVPNDQYRDYQYATYEISKYLVIDYAEVDGVIYHPYDEYTIGVNPTITLHYASETIYPVDLDTEVNQDDVDAWFGEEGYVFDGWYTDPEGGARVFTVSDEGNTNVYAHYRDENAPTYHVTIERLDNSIIEADVSVGTKIKLEQDKYIYSAYTDLYDDDYSSISVVTTNFIHTADKYMVGGLLKSAGSIITINQDTIIRAYETNVTREILDYKEPERDGFVGYYDDIDFSHKIDFNTASENNFPGVGYAHYEPEIPEGYVRVDFDENIYAVPMGEELDLPDGQTKDSDYFYILLYFGKINKEPVWLYLQTDYTFTGYTVNGVSYNAGDTVVANTDLVIRSVYSGSTDYDDGTKDEFNVTYPNIPVFEDLETQPSEWLIDVENNIAVEDVSSIKENTSLYAKYSGSATIYIDNEPYEEVAVGTLYTLPTNTTNKDSEILSTVTFNHNDADNTVTTSNVYKVYTPDGWLINDTAYTSGKKYTVNGDVYLVSNYKETITAAKFPKNPYKENARFDGWYTLDNGQGEKVTTYDGEDDLTLYGYFVEQAHIVDPATGEEEIVDKGTKITLETLDDKEEKSVNITFNYNYTGAPDPKVVTITTQEKFKGWLINGVHYDAGSEITVDEDITRQAEYELVINNKNLPNDPERTGYSFMGWYNSPIKLIAKLVDVTEIVTPTTVYAQWNEFDSETEVRLTWDGVVTIHNKGEEISLVKDGQNTTELIAEVTFRMNNPLYSDMIYKINRETSVDHLVINDTDYEASGTYTLNEDTVITTVYTESITYPNMPVINDDAFIGFYTTPTGGDKVNSMEGITQNTIYYAHWTEETVPVDIDGEIIDVPKGTTKKLEEGKVKPLDIIALTLEYNAGVDKEVTFTRTYLFDHYLINDVVYYPGQEYTYNEATTIRSIYTETDTNSFVGTYNDNWDIGGYVDPVGYITGWYDTTNLVDLDTVTGVSSELDGKTLLAHYALDGSVNVYIDSMDPYEQAIGRHTLIDPTLTLTLDVPDADTFEVIFDYNNGTGNTTTVEVGRTYTFHHFTADGKGEYQRDSEYDFGKDTYIRSEYSIAYTYPNTPENTNPNFKGWYTRPVGGEEISLTNITEATTVYAQQK